MAIEFPCWNCGLTIHASEAHANRQCKCGNCGSVNRILGSRTPGAEEGGYTLEPDRLSPNSRRGLPELDQSERESESPSLVGFLGFLLLILGLGVLGYYLLVFETETPRQATDLLLQEVKVDSGLRHKQLIGSLCGGLLTIAGAIMLGLGALRR
jgi:hypothetical protein